MKKKYSNLSTRISKSEIDLEETKKVFKDLSPKSLRSLVGFDNFGGNVEIYKILKEERNDVFIAEYLPSIYRAIKCDYYDLLKWLFSLKYPLYKRDVRSMYMTCIWFDKIKILGLLCDEVPMSFEEIEKYVGDLSKKNFKIYTFLLNRLR